MALERHRIQKQDFPTAAQGYDPKAVDAHLSQIADEVDRLRSTAGGSSQGFAATTSDRVRAILEAAEASASDIIAQAKREAETAAGEIVRRAKDEAEALRNHAVTERAGRPWPGEEAGASQTG